MDYDNIQQNLNTRVVFKEPRGMIRWLQLLFAVLAFALVVDFYTTIGIDFTCPPTNGTSTTSSTSTTTSTSTTSTTAAPSSPASTSAQPLVGQELRSAALQVSYPFDFSQLPVHNPCPGTNFTYRHVSLDGSPQFFVMTGVLSLVYASSTLIIYLLFSSTYHMLPVLPVADLIITGILCLFWFIASSSFSSGVSLLKTTINYQALEQTLCPGDFINRGANCSASLTDVPNWKGLNIGLVSGFSSCFLWGAGMWYVFKETHFHTPSNPLA